MASPDPPGAISTELDAVACARAQLCWAVGSYKTAHKTLLYAERWNGRAWSPVSLPSPKTSMLPSLSAISCPAAAQCWAVGGSLQGTGRPATLIERWNGHSWRIVSGPAVGDSSSLHGISCTSTRDCWAAGFWLRLNGQGQPTKGGVLTERWNGERWSRVNAGSASPGNELNAVSCTSRRFCMASGFQPAAGGANGPLAERWNGSSWAVTPSGDAAGGFGVSCPSRSWCMATGAGTLTERWNGSSWVTVPSPDAPGGVTEVALQGVDCLSAKLCWAAGFWVPETGPDFVLIERWNGSTWTIVA